MIRLPRPLLIAISGFAGVVLISAMTSLAAANVVPDTAAGQSTATVEVDDVIPPECQSFHLDGVISGNGVIVGTNQSDLIVGGNGTDTISGLNQKDCILGGGGNDILFGGNSEDVLFGGNGNDVIDGGNGQDICFGGAGLDTFISCDTAYP